MVWSVRFSTSHCGSSTLGNQHCAPFFTFATGATLELSRAQVAPRLCVGGSAVARDRQMLREAGVTHVVNCVGMLPPAAPFADELQYLVLHLLGAPRCAVRSPYISALTLICHSVSTPNTLQTVPGTLFECDMTLTRWLAD